MSNLDTVKNLAKVYKVKGVRKIRLAGAPRYWVGRQGECVPAEFLDALLAVGVKVQDEALARQLAAKGRLDIITVWG